MRQNLWPFGIIKNVESVREYLILYFLPWKVNRLKSASINISVCVCYTVTDMLYEVMNMMPLHKADENTSQTPGCPTLSILTLTEEI